MRAYFMKNRAKPSIQRLRPYQNGSHCEELIANHKKVLKLDSNEATVTPSARVTAALVQYIQGGPLNWYPDVESAALVRALTRYTGLSGDHILTFNGSDHALETVARTFLGMGDEAILFTPTYDHFRVYAESCDAHIVTVPETLPGKLVDKVAAHVTERTKLIYLVNPNNPTGRLVSEDEVAAALARFPRVLFVIDEAYFEFCDRTVKALVPLYGNLVVTRSFSKAFGLAGLRCGYILAQPGLCGEIAKVRVGKNINALAQIAATAALEDLDHMKRYVEEVSIAKQWLVRQCEGLGLSVWSTPVNFILVKAAQPVKVAAYLKERRIYVRDRSTVEGLDGMLRVTVGDPLLMKRFWRVFETIPKEYLTTETAKEDSVIRK